MRAMLRLNVDMKSSATMSIGEVAGHFGLATHVLRHWETMGLLSPARGTGGHRRYGRRDLYRVASILLAKEAGLALTDIRGILTSADLENRRKIQRRHRDELVRRIAKTRAALDLIEGGLTCDYEDITECPTFQSLVADRMSSRARLPMPDGETQAASRG
ncbi:MAG TPA: MerR family transcriptional regulator [Streptosporangiaceae bacterium]